MKKIVDYIIGFVDRYFKILLLVLLFLICLKLDTIAEYLPGDTSMSGVESRLDDMAKNIRVIAYTRRY